jgi:acyl-CoA hydrolase
VRTGHIRHVCTAFATMVALGEDDRPTPLPRIVPETPDEQRRCAHAHHRRDLRLAESP